MDKLLKIDQVAEQLQVSKSLVYKWVHCGYIPHVKLGSLVRIQEDSLARWLKRKERTGRTQLRRECPI